MIVVLPASLVVIFISLTNLKLCFETSLCSDQPFLCQAEGCCRYDRHNLKEDCVTKRRIVKLTTWLNGKERGGVRLYLYGCSRTIYKRDKRPSSFSIRLLTEASGKTWLILWNSGALDILDPSKRTGSINLKWKMMAIQNEACIIIVMMKTENLF